MTKLPEPFASRIEEKAKELGHYNWHYNADRTKVYDEVDEAFTAGAEALYNMLAPEIEALKAEVERLNQDLERKSREIGRSEHRGNTVDYIYAKCETYGNQARELYLENARLREALLKYVPIGAYNPLTDEFNDFAALKALEQETKGATNE